MKAQVQWMAASPMWSTLLRNNNRTGTRKPTLLRFASDTFMEDLAALLEEDPTQLVDLEAKKESFQERQAGVKKSIWRSPEPAHLKLYQPAHGHFYLVACTLVCRKPGLPDHKVDLAKKQKVSFVLRRRVTSTTNNVTSTREYGWVADSTTKTAGWQEVTSVQTVLTDEERLPLFPMAFTEDDRTRRMFVGYIPVSSRETFQAAGELAPFPASDEMTLDDPRLEEFNQRVRDVIEEIGTASSTELSVTDKRTLSWYLLADLADILMLHLPAVWEAIETGNTSGMADKEAQTLLYTTLTQWTTVGDTTWADALNTVFLGQSAPYDDDDTTTMPPTEYELSASDPPLYDEAGGSVFQLLELLVEAALKEVSIPEQVEIKVPKFDPGSGDLYVVRCVYERPRCEPWEKPVVSDASTTFQLASFYDPDAPARSIRITLPADTSVAGLRKYTKNVAFQMSKEFRSQLSKITEKTLTDEEVATGTTFDLGHICSFSIPIITIVAFILLMLMVIILNIIFWWIPFFKICFPLKAR